MIDEKNVLKQTEQLKQSQFADERFVAGVAAVEILIEAAQKVVYEWTPCSDGLPDEKGMYLITARVYDKKEIQYAYYQKEIGLFICNGTAIAWMPLPPAFVEGDKE